MRQAVVWSKDNGTLDQKNNKVYVINQVLMFGNLEEIKELKREYGEAEVRRVFIEQPTNVYSKSAFNLIKNFILRIGIDLDSRRYIKSVY